MATIDYKEKYEQALERARQFSEKPYLEDSAGIVEYIFPELKESEDERMRKHLIGVVELYYGNTDEQEKKDCLAWLEKRGEQKPVDKIQLGKKYKCIASPRYSTFRIGEIYKPEDKFLCSLMNFCSDCFEPIEDEQKPAYTKEYDFHGIKFIPKFAKGDIIKDKKCGEVSTIEDFSYDTGLYTHTYGQFPITIQDNYEIIAQKPAWSKEDEKIIRRIDSLLYSQCKIHGSEYEEIHNWLKSLTPQPKQEWSEEDERIRQEAIRILSDAADSYTEGSGGYAPSWARCIPWLKSLRPQNRWKPSDEQMEALDDAISSRDIKYDVLSELWKDLKKLKEE